MIPLVLLLSRRSLKKEITIVLMVVALVFILPLMAVASLTNVGALAKEDDNSQLFTGTASTANTYDYGFCTFWVAQRRIEVGLPIPNNWGDAHYWDNNSALAGYTVDHKPDVYAIMQTDAGDLGHVAFVEEVSPDGGWKVSEMNVKGWDILSSRTFKPGQAKDYNFIH